MNWKNRNYTNKLKSGDTIQLYGWVDAIRDHGHLLFVHIRDNSGIVQLVFDPEVNKVAYDTAQTLRNEYVISVTGTVIDRDKEAINPHIPTGSIEIIVDNLEVLSESETPPFVVSEKDAVDESDDNTFDVNEDTRLRYRYMDLRRPSMRHNIAMRSKLMKVMRDYLDDQNFLDIETPVLTKSTPEGARDYLVPSRTHEGKFFALPQSPQLFKQLLMVSGMERYFQIVRCFRDEDLRPNRQPEFTQLDLEASFIDEEYIYSLVEGLINRVFAAADIPLPETFPRITYDEAMSKYGSDAPDMRFDMPMIEVTDLLPKCGYKIFNSIIAGGGMIKGMVIPGQADALSRNLLQNELATKVIQKMGGKGMTWMKLIDGKLESNVVQFFDESEQKGLIERLGAKDGDVLVLIADTNHKLVNEVLGRFRVFIADRQGLIPKDVFAPVWVTDFPMFESKDGKIHAMHHPFTLPNSDIPDRSDTEAVIALKARAYDIVINGEEVGGGSIRINRADMQQQVFDLLGLSPEEIEAKFGFFVKALQYGAPPHGGLALGLDRLVAMVLGTESIREVIAFPKNRVAHCPLTDAPSQVALDQLEELHIKPILSTPKTVT